MSKSWNTVQLPKLQNLMSYIIIKIFYNISIRQVKKIIYYVRKTTFVSCKILQRHAINLGKCIVFSEKLVYYASRKKKVFPNTSRENCSFTVCFKTRKLLISQLLLFSPLLMKIAILLPQNSLWKYNWH